MDLDLESVADELYGVALGEFVSTRTAREKAARGTGDRALAASIHRLAKPSATAWLANQLVRRHRAELQPLLDLGADLRAAMASLSGPELRTLGQQQHRLIAALVTRAGALAAADGRQVSADTARGLEQTLHAALADETTAQTLLTGRLSEALDDSGFSLGAPLTGPPTGRSAGDSAGRSAGRSAGDSAGSSAGRSAGRSAGGSERRPVAAPVDRTELRRARAAVEHTVAVRDQALAVATEAEAAVDDTAARIARLREELDQAGAEKTRRDREHHRRRSEATQAERAVAAARKKLDALSQSH